MDASILIYLERIEAHLSFIVLFIMCSLIALGVTKLIKFIIRKVKLKNERLRNSSPRTP